MSIAMMLDPIRKWGRLFRNKSADTTRDRIEWLDGLRGLAALGVVEFHFYIGTITLSQEAPSWVNHLAASGRYGVWLFFVISGFILTHTLLPRSGLRTARGVGLYMLRRSIRLDPVYWVILTLFIAASFWLSNSDWITPEGRWAHRLFYNYFYFVPQPLDMGFPYPAGYQLFYITPVWTLMSEVQFYLLFSCVVAFINNTSKPDLYFFCSILAMIGLGAFTLMKQYPIGYWMFPHLICFTVGISVALLHRKTKGAGILLGLCFLVLATAIIRGDPSRKALATLCVGLLFLVMLYWSPAQRLMSHNVMVWLGTLSYSVYLLHMLVVYALQDFWGAFVQGGLYSDIALMLVGICTAFGLSVVTYQLVELPTLRWSKRIKFAEPR